MTERKKIESTGGDSCNGSSAEISGVGSMLCSDFAKWEQRCLNYSRSAIKLAVVPASIALQFTSALSKLPVRT